jgi:hypothetical protein
MVFVAGVGADADADTDETALMGMLRVLCWRSQDSLPATTLIWAPTPHHHIARPTAVSREP